MKKVAIIYGSTTGNTETAAEMIKNNLSDAHVVISSVSNATDTMVQEADLVLFGSSTWGYGELQDEFQDYYDKCMTKELLSGKHVAVFGCGDEDSFPDVFCQATDIINEKVVELGGNIICNNLRISGNPADFDAQIKDFINNL